MFGIWPTLLCRSFHLHTYIGLECCEVLATKQACFHESQGDVMYLLPFICTHPPTHVIILCAIYYTVLTLWPFEYFIQKLVPVGTIHYPLEPISDSVQLLRTAHHAVDHKLLLHDIWQFFCEQKTSTFFCLFWIFAVTLTGCFSRNLLSLDYYILC